MKQAPTAAECPGVSVTSSRLSSQGLLEVKTGSASTLDADQNPSAGSSPPAQMTSRKRSFSTSQQQEPQPLVQSEGAEAAATSASMQSEGVQPEPKPNHRAKRQAVESNNEEQDQQPFESMPLIEQVSVPEVVALAQQHSVVWCRVKGFPAWPVRFIQASSTLFHLTQLAPEAQNLFVHLPRDGMYL